MNEIERFSIYGESSIDLSPTVKAEDDLMWLGENEFLSWPEGS